MKKTVFTGITILISYIWGSCHSTNNEWYLVWEDNFNKNSIDTCVWSKIPRGTADWNHYMSEYDSLYDVKKGNLILKGMVNPGIPNDTVPYITGGIHSYKKKGFSHGKIEIRAKVENASGAWPAIWLLAFDDEPWPYSGEIDIMEHLNYDTVAYQTVHSYYTYTLKEEDIPPHFTTGAIYNNDYNIYSVELHADSLVFAINGNHTMTYPRIETNKDGQFPFDRSFYLLLDMQLEGSWVGKVVPEDLPVAMYIDWIRFYQKGSKFKNHNLRQKRLCDDSNNKYPLPR